MSVAGGCRLRDDLLRSPFAAPKREATIVLALLTCLVMLSPGIRAQGEATFVPPHSDEGLDADGDGFFDFLHLDIHVNAAVSGNFFIPVELYDITGTVLITDRFTNQFIDGTTVVSLDLSGRDIFESGIDGPYNVSLGLFDEEFNLDDATFHETAPYSYTEFEPPAAAFAPPHADEGVDTDADGLFDFLRVDVTVNVSDAGTYRMDADLVDSSFSSITSESITFSATPGLTVIGVDFLGWSIYANGVDGPYQVYLFLFDPAFGFLGSDLHSTDSYGFVEFEVPPISFSPPHADAGVDTDEDGLFNLLRIDVQLDVVQAGTYTVQGLDRKSVV